MFIRLLFNETLSAQSSFGIRVKHIISSMTSLHQGEIVSAAANALYFGLLDL